MKPTANTLLNIMVGCLVLAAFGALAMMYYAPPNHGVYQEPCLATLPTTYGLQIIKEVDYRGASGGVVQLDLLIYREEPEPMYFTQHCVFENALYLMSWQEEQTPLPLPDGTTLYE